MTTVFMESGTSATYGFDLFTSTGGTIASSNLASNMSQRAIEFSATVAGLATREVHQVAGRFSVRLGGPDSGSNNFPTIGNANAGTIMRIGGSSALGVFLQNTGVLCLFTSDNISTIKTGTTNITGSGVKRIALCWNITSTTNWSAKLYINGNLELSASNADASLNNVSVLYQTIGGGAGTSSWNYTSKWYASDLYIDDNSSLDDVAGDIRVTSKLPSKLNTNNFDTLGGSGTNRYDRVSERPLSTTNYIQHAAISDVQENFAIQGELEGDTNLCGAQIIARAAWAVATRTLLSGFQTWAGNSGKTAGTTLTVGLSGINNDSRYVGTTVLLAFAMDGATGTVSATDNASNTYVVDVDKAAASPGSTNVRVCIIRGYLASVTNFTPITITHPSVTARAACAGVFLVDQSTPLDTSTSNVGSSATPSSGATGTTAQANEVIFGALAYETNIAGRATGGGASMTPAGTLLTTYGTDGGGSASNVQAAVLYAHQTATNAQTASWTGGASTDWAAAIATYKCSGFGEGTPNVMNNGTEGSVTLTTSQAAHMNIVDGGGYPNNPAAVGMRSSNVIADTYMYECGMLIAYIPGPPTHHHHKWNPTFNPVLAQ
jgi:hypothetical protein